MPPRKRLGQLLTELKVIDDHQLQSALGHQRQWGGKLGAILVQKGFCGEEQLVSALAQHLGMERVKLAEAKIDPKAVKLVSRQIAEKLHVFPYQVTGAGRSEVISIAMSDPTDLSSVDQLAFHTGKRIKPILAADSEVTNAISAHYGAAEEKKEPTDKVAPPAGAAPAAQPGFPKRIEPQPPAGLAPAAARPPPFAPPPPAAKAEESAPAPAQAAAAQQAVDLPEDDGGDLGLEPIAAHSQFGDAVSGSEEVAGEGSAGDTMEGLVSAGVQHEGAEEARSAGVQAADWGEPGTVAPPAAGEAWSEPAPDSGWGAAPSAEAGWGAAEAAAGPTVPAPGAEAGQGWSMEAPATSAGWSAPSGEQAWEASGAPAEEEAPSEALPTDAILGAVQELGAGAGEEGWEEPASAAAGQAEQPEAAASQPLAAAPEPEEEQPLPGDLDRALEAEPAPAPEEEAPPPVEALHEAPADQGEEAPSPPEAGLGLDAPAGLRPEPAEGDRERPPELMLEPSPELDLDAPRDLDREAASAELGIEALAERALEASAEPHEARVEALESAPARDGDTEPIPPPAFAPAPEEHEAEPPDAWAASDDPLAAEAAPAAEERALPGPVTDEFANPLQAATPMEEPPSLPMEEPSSPPVEEPPSAPAESPVAEVEGQSAQAAEEPAAQEDVPAPATTERFAGQEEIDESWSPQAGPAPQDNRWIGEALEGPAPLSPADLGTLSSIGIEPTDGVGALRLLAALVRMLNRSQLIEPDELRAEIRESCAAAAAAAQDGVEGEDSPSGPAPEGSTAET
ncbi:MAG TPA: hypothetical protein VMK66_11615 [Myxococcales bacterium]|nr:hypothetical protein [Myxococcales bacterium]